MMDPAYSIQGRRSQNRFHSVNSELDLFTSDLLEKDCHGGDVTQCESLQRITTVLKKQMTLKIQKANEKKPNVRSSDNMTSNLLAIYQSEVYGNEQPMIKLNRTSVYDFITFKLGADYNTVALLNDFHHLLFQHNTEHDFESIYNVLRQRTNSMCTAKECPLMHHITDKEYKHDMDDDNNIKEMESIQTMAQIHCYFLHSYEMSYRLSNKELQPLEISSGDERLSMIYRFVNKKHVKIERPYAKYISNADRVRAQIQGKKYYYWESYKTRHSLDVVNGKMVSDWYISAKYKDLKEELAQKMSKQTMECFLLKIKHIMQCNKAKKLRANGAAQLLRDYFIEKRSPITKNHILALISYCNHCELRRAFVHSFKSKIYHSEYVHLAKYLRECTEIYGHSLRSETDDIFHCIRSERFHQILICFDVPKSCTNSLYVAVNMAKNIQKGLVLQLSRDRYNVHQYTHSHNAVSSYFDCKWISNAVYENEMIFFNPSETFKIANILDMERGLNYRAYVSATHVLNGMLHCAEDTEHKQSKHDVKTIGVLIQNQLNTNRNAHVPSYVDTLFRMWCENAHDVLNIDIDKLHDVYHIAKNYLVSEDDSWIDLNNLCILFKNAKKIIIKGLRLTDITFRRLLHWMDSQKTRPSKLTQIVLKYPNEDDVDVEEALKKYGQAIHFRNWETFHYQDLHHDDLITIYFISQAHYTGDNAPDVYVDSFAFELWKWLGSKPQIEGKELLSYIQKRCSSDDDVWLMMDNLIKYNYLHTVPCKSDVCYRVEWDKCRTFVHKNEPHRSKWSIGTKVQVYSSYHKTWKQAVVVDEINDILTVLFEDHKTNMSIDRFQYNMIDFPKKRYSIKTSTKSGVQFTDFVLNTNTGTSTAAANSPSKRLSFYSLNASAPSSRRSTLTSKIHEAAEMFARISPQLAPVLSPHQMHDVNLSMELPLFQGQERSKFALENGLSTRTTMMSMKSMNLTCEFAPCPGDPFWEYYRTVGDLSRANCQEMTTVMHMISAEDIMRMLLQKWFHKKIEPIELPYINSYTSRFNKDDFTLQSTTIISFIRQSLNRLQSYKGHPDSFDIPYLTQQFNDYYQDNGDSREIPDWSELRSSSFRSFRSDHGNESAVNIIGQNIFSYLDQNSFLNSCVVCRSWLYCGRFSRSRSHIELRLWNGLRHLVLDSDLNNIVTESNDIISIDEFIRNNNLHFASVNDDNLDKHMDENDELYEYNDDNMDAANDILLDYVTGRRQTRTPQPAFSTRTSLKNQDITTAVPRFFSKRVECGMFGNICKLEFDFNIPSNNKLIYFINQSLVDSYWETLSMFLQIETLRSLDILLPDPHILLLSYILQHSNNYTSYSKRIVFPSIGIPKSKCICATKHLSFLRFAVKSLTLSSLLHMLDTHFQHYHHPMHHGDNYKHRSPHEPNYGQFMYAQSQKLEYSKLKIYKLCKKVIYKSLIFDISNALYDLNHSPVKVTKIEHLSFCDIKAVSSEFTRLLDNNGAHLKRIDFMFTQKCLQPKYESVHTKMQMNDMLASSSNGMLHSASSSTLPAGNTTLSGGYSSTMSINIQNYQSSNLSMSNINYNVSGTHFQDRSGVIADNHHQKDVNKKKLRTQQTLTDLFHAVIKYVKKQCHKIHAHNHQIKKRFKLAKNTKHSKFLEITYANKLKILPLDTLSFSFPVDVDIFLLDGFVELLSWFEMNEFSEISLKNIYFDGGALSPFAHSGDNNKLLSWNDLLQSQMLNIESLIMRRALYSTQVFDHFCDGFVSNVKYIDLQIIYYSDEMYIDDASFLDDASSLNNLQVINSNNSSTTINAKSQQIKELLQALEQCQRLEICKLDLIQYAKDYNAIAPSFDILWIDQFVKSLNIQKTIKKLSITFNELSTREFEDRTPTLKYVKRTHLNLGSILRINGAFKNEIEQMIMSWFADFNAPLRQVTFIRYFLDSHGSNRRYKDDENYVDFAQKMQESHNKNTINEYDNNHNVAYYDVTKKRDSDFCGGDVCGDLVKILQLQNPVVS